MRLDLYDGGFFGNPDTVKFEDAVEIAWGQFKEWKRRNSVSCSQPHFSAASVPRPRL